MAHSSVPSGLLSPEAEQLTDGLLWIAGLAQGVPDGPGGDHGGQAVDSREALANAPIVSSPT